jgi:hypothetical protein
LAAKGRFVAAVLIEGIIYGGQDFESFFKAEA